MEMLDSQTIRHDLLGMEVILHKVEKRGALYVVLVLKLGEDSRVIPARLFPGSLPTDEDVSLDAISARAKSEIGPHGGPDVEIEFLIKRRVIGSVFLSQMSKKIDEPTLRYNKMFAVLRRLHSDDDAFFSEIKNRATGVITKREKAALKRAGLEDDLDYSFARQDYRLPMDFRLFYLSDNKKFRLEDFVPSDVRTGYEGRFTRVPDAQTATTENGHSADETDEPRDSNEDDPILESSGRNVYSEDGEFIAYEQSFSISGDKFQEAIKRNIVRDMTAILRALEPEQLKSLIDDPTRALTDDEVWRLTFPQDVVQPREGVPRLSPEIAELIRVSVILDEDGDVMYDGGVD